MTWANFVHSCWLLILKALSIIFRQKRGRLDNYLRIFIIMCWPKPLRWAPCVLRSIDIIKIIHHLLSIVIVQLDPYVWGARWLLLCVLFRLIFRKCFLRLARFLQLLSCEKLPLSDYFCLDHTQGTWLLENVICAPSQRKYAEVSRRILVGLRIISAEHHDIVS